MILDLMDAITKDEELVCAFHWRCPVWISSRIGKRNEKKPFSEFKWMMMQDIKRQKQSQECMGKGFLWIIWRGDNSFLEPA